MRILAILTAGFALGLILALGLGGPWLLIPGVLLSLCLPGTRWKKLRLPALILGGMGLGILWFSLWSLVYLQPLRQISGKPETMTVLITDHGRQVPGGSLYRGKTRLEGRTYGLELLSGEDYEPGDRLRGSFLGEANQPGFRSRGNQALSRGIALRLRPQGEILVREGRGDFSCLASRLRRSILTRIRDIFPPDTAGFAGALLLGDSQGLEPQTAWDLSVSGIRHVVAVSGLHVSILWMLLSIATDRRQWLTFLVGAPVLVGFCAVTGFSPSVVRASLMITVMMAAPLLGRQYDGITGLAFAALVMMIFNPMVIASVSFQLSAASVLGMLVLFKPLKNWLRLRLPNLTGRWAKAYEWICSSWAVSLSALAAVTPLTAWHFGSLTLISPVTNLLTVWAVIWIFWGVLMTVLLSFILWGPACLLADLTALLIRFVLWVAGAMAKIPFGALYTENPLVLIWLLGFYLLAWILLFGRRKHPAIFGWTAAVSLSLVLLVSWILPRQADLRVTVPELPEGQSVILQSRGRTYVVICRDRDPVRTADTLSGLLLGQGIRRVEGLILTDPASSELRGAELLLQRVEAKQVFLPEGVETELGTAWLREPWHDHAGTGTIGIFPAEKQGKTHEKGLCVLFEAEDYDILITGGDRIRSLPENRKIHCLIPDSENMEDLLKAVSPETVILPTMGPETILALRQRGIRPVQTAEQGTFIIRR